MRISPQETRMARKTKILLGITKANWGGAQRYCFDIATRLPRDKFEVAVMAGTPGELIEKLKTAGVRTVAIPGLSRDIRWLGELLTLKRLISILCNERPDVLHLSSPKMAGLGALAGRVLGIPKIIITIHGWSFFEDRSFIARSAIWFFSWLTAVLAYKVILITSLDFQAAKKFPFMPKNKFVLIPNGIHTSLHFMERGAARKTLKNLAPFDEASFIIGTVAELTPNKNLPTLIKAVAELPPGISCVIIGSGEKKDELKKLIDKFGLAKRVFLTGFVADAQQLLPGFDCFVMSSTKEGLPYVIMEAMAAGLAVVGTKVGGIPDLIQDGETGLLVPPKEPSLLAQKLFWLVEHPELRASLIQKAGIRVNSEFSLDKMVKRTVGLYTAP